MAEAPHRLGLAAPERERASMAAPIAGSPLGRAASAGECGHGPGRRIVGEPVDRGLVDQRVDARLLVEGEQLAGSLVAVSVHPWCGKAVGQRWQPCLRRGRMESATVGLGRAACRRSPAPRPSGRSVGDYHRLAYRLLEMAISFELE